MANSTYTSSNISHLLQVTGYTKSGIFYKEFIKMLAVIHLLFMYSSCKLFKKMCSLPVVFLSGKK